MQILRVFIDMDKKIVTVWYRWNNENKDYEFNHYEDGWDESQEKPFSDISKQQKDWKKAKWRKKFGHLVERENKAPLLENSDIKEEISC